MFGSFFSEILNSCASIDASMDTTSIEFLLVDSMRRQ